MSDAAPSECGTCGTSVPKGASKCPGCGSVFGEQNRCPHCSAIAAVRPTSSGGHVCMACGKPRSLGPGVTVFDTGVKSRAAGAGLRTMGIVTIGAGLFAAVAIAAVGGWLIAAAAVGAAGVGLGAMMMKKASSAGYSSGHERARQIQIMNLAEKHQGVLYVTDVARELHITQGEADAALSTMADGSRIWAEVTTDGLIRYEFREMRARQGLQVRVADDIEAAEQHGHVETELEAAEREVEEFLNN